MSGILDVIMKTQIVNYHIYIEQDEDGMFVASVPALQGCYAEGDSFEEAVENAKDVIKLHLESRRERGEILDDSDMEFIGVKQFSLSYGVSSNH